MCTHDFLTCCESEIDSEIEQFLNRLLLIFRKLVVVVRIVQISRVAVIVVARATAVVVYVNAWQLAGVRVFVDCCPVSGTSDIWRR